MSDGDDYVVDSIVTVISGGGLAFIGKGIALGMGFFTQLLMARILTTGEYGAVILTFAVIKITQTFSRIGLDEGMLRKIPEYEDDPNKLRGIIKSGLSLSVLIAVIAGILLFILAPILSTRVFGDPSMVGLLRIGAFGAPLAVIGVVSTSIARGRRSAKPHTYVNQIIRPGSRLLFIGLLIGAGYGSIGAVAGQVTAMTIAAVAALWYVYQLYPRTEGPDEYMVRTIVAFSLPLTVVHGMNFLLYNTDTFLIGYYLSTSEVGIYNVSFQIRNVLNVLVVTVGFLLPSVLARLETQGQTGKLREIYQYTTKWILLLTFPLFISLFFVPDIWLDKIFGSRYASGTVALQVLGIGVMFSALMGVSGPSLVGLGKNRVIMYTSGLAMVTNLVLNVILIPKFGISGAAIASTIAVIVTESLNLVLLYTSYDILPVRRQYLIPPIVSGILAGVTIQIEIGYSNFGGFLGWCIFYGILVILISVSDRDKEIANKIWHTISEKYS